MQSEIIEHTDNLPATIEELIDFEIVTNSAVQSFKAKLRACNKSEIAKDYVDITLRDGRKMSHLNIEANARLGELIKNSELKRNKEGGTQSTSLHSLPIGINKEISRVARAISDNPEIVEEIFATKTNDIPTKHDILKAIKNKKHEEKIEERKKEIEKGTDKSDGLYDIIVIDPPWNYGTKYDADHARRACPYPEMSFEELEQIKLPAKKDCILWCWTTHQFIYDAIELLEKWGFEYKCILVWDKEKMGIGKWLRLQTEFCLLGIKGKPLWEHKDIRDIIREPRTGHSNKPDCFYKMIDDNFVGRKLDYFYGKEREGWDRIGTGENSLSE